MKVRKTKQFEAWFNDLRDVRARARIQVRIDRLVLGLLGDAKFFDGIGELRIDYGPGYRVYFARRGTEIVVVLAGGDKATQSRDIKFAKALAEGLAMKTETTRWDSADYLTDAEAIAAYLEAAFEDGEPQVIAHSLGVVARAKGMTAIAKEAGVTREALYRALSENGDPRLTTLLGVMKALGLQLSLKPAA